MPGTPSTPQPTLWKEYERLRSFILRDARWTHLLPTDPVRRLVGTPGSQTEPSDELPALGAQTIARRMRRKPHRRRDGEG